MSNSNYQKYLKYKLKYLDLKNELEGGNNQLEYENDELNGGANPLNIQINDPDELQHLQNDINKKVLDFKKQFNDLTQENQQLKTALSVAQSSSVPQSSVAQSSSVAQPLRVAQSSSVAQPSVPQPSVAQSAHSLFSSKSSSTPQSQSEYDDIELAKLIHLKSNGGKLSSTDQVKYDNLIQKYA